MGTSYNPPIVTDGLVFCVDAANQRSYPKSGTTWSDLVGANNGTMQNMTSANYSSDNGGVLSFDGADDYVDFGTSPTDSIRGGSEFTIDLWVKKANSNKDANIGSWNQSNRHGFFFQWFTDSNLYFGISSGGTNYNYINLTWTNDWYYIAGVFDGSIASYDDRAKIYVNGNRKPRNGNFGNVISSVSTTASKFWIGAFENYGSKTTGDISNAHLYNRALTPDEIRQNYQATLGRFT